MTREEILLNALDQAVKNGFDGKDFRSAFEHSPRLPNGTLLVVNALVNNPYGLICQHAFAKAFFGEMHTKAFKDKTVLVPDWQFHLKQMVVADDPLRYLEKFLILNLPESTTFWK